MAVFYKKIDTPLGDMVAVFSDKGGLRELKFDDNGTMLEKIREKQDAKLAQGALSQKLEAELELYFMGKLKRFDIELDLQGTEFQKRVWSVLQQIPYGKTISYGKQALSCGGVNYARAVASANGKNPVSILVPCHRVVGAKGQIGGYHWGVERKIKLLEIENENTGNIFCK